MNYLSSILTGAALALLLAACDGTGEPSASGAEESGKQVAGETAPGGARAGAVDLADTQWRLVSLGGEPVDLPGGSGMAPRIHFLPDGDVSGFGGCNRFSGTYSLEDGLSFGPIASTKMACPQIGDVERRFFSAISSTTGHRVEDGDLVLLDAEGSPLARLTPAAEAGKSG